MPNPSRQLRCDTSMAHLSCTSELHGTVITYAAAATISGLRITDLHTRLDDESVCTRTLLCKPKHCAVRSSLQVDISSDVLETSVKRAGCGGVVVTAASNRSRIWFLFAIPHVRRGIPSFRTAYSVPVAASIQVCMIASFILSHYLRCRFYV